jgi:hypothetical protein
MALNINPDKYVRKAVFDMVNDSVVSGKTIKVFDSRVTGNKNLTEYVLMSSQSKDVLKNTKCNYEWETSLLIEIYTRFPSAGNTGSRVLLNDIEEHVFNLLNNDFVVDSFSIVIKTVTNEYSGLETVTDAENIYRSFLRLNLILR